MKDFIEENTLSDLKLYTKVRDQLLKELGSIRTTRVDEAPRTKKIFSETLDTIVIEMLNQALGEIVMSRTWQPLNILKNLV